MNPERFRDSPSGRLLKVGQGATAYWAFVPNPLPPDLPLDAPLVNLLSSADRVLGELAGLGRTIYNPHLLIRPFVRREAVLSSRIEGTRADIAEVYAYEAGQLPLPGMPAPAESDVREVLNYVYALEHGLKRLGDLPLSLRLIREVHRQLMAKVRGEHATPGEFRRSQNWIGPPECTLSTADFVPPPVEQMWESLDSFEKYLRSGEDHPPLLRLALIHYQFEAIHPFLDGNGRVGRLLVPLLLVHWGLLPHPLLYLSACFEQHRDDYYRLLLAVSERGAWREWVSFFLVGVAEQARDAIVRAKRLQDLRMQCRERLTQARTSALSLALVDSLFDSPFVTIPQAQRVLDVTYPSAQRHVQRLVKAGILRQVGTATYGKVFVADQILRIVGDSQD